ncbi:MAG: hypothetical protein Kow0099_09690 [Candidatus Abyssubacteria bacterium]
MIQRKYNLNVCLAIMVAAFLVTLALGALQKQYGIFGAPDAAASQFIKSIRVVPLTVAMTVITSLGDELGLMAISCIIFWLGYTAEFIAFLLMLLFGNAVNTHLKEFFELPRPQSHEISTIIRAQGYGYPSGHSLIGMFYSWLIYSFVRKYWPICLLAALLMAFSRIYLGVHYFSDTIGGLIFGLGIVIGATGIYGHVRDLANLRETIRRSLALKVTLALVLSFFYLAVAWGQPEASRYAGFLAGFFILYPMLGFRWRSRNIFFTILVALLGLAVLLGLRIGLGMMLPSMGWAHYLRYSIIGAVLAGSPFIFTKIGLLKRRDESAPEPEPHPAKPQ